MPRSREINVQDSFLFERLKNRATVEVGLTTGVVVTGVLRRYDRFCLIVETGTQEVLIYKGAIATFTGNGEEHARAEARPERLNAGRGGGRTWVVGAQ